MNTTVELNGRTIDLSAVLPLTIGDWKLLEKRHGITPDRLRTLNFADASQLAFYVLRKADETVTQDDVDALAFNDPTIQTIFKSLQQEEQEADGPFSTSSTL